MLNIIENKSSFSNDELVKMVRRENNSKRNYLLVDSKQGKHIPADPSDVIRLFTELGSQIKKYRSRMEWSQEELAEELEMKIAEAMKGNVEECAAE